ncbi:hypothetical protein SESBI_47629 [Sesbania bispinosa]|nr:hypothetical protein SESBI_47629 [Sesbania bispinosa]
MKAILLGSGTPSSAIQLESYHQSHTMQGTSGCTYLAFSPMPQPMEFVVIILLQHLNQILCHKESVIIPITNHLTFSISSLTVSDTMRDMRIPSLFPFGCLYINMEVSPEIFNFGRRSSSPGLSLHILV